MKNIVLLLILLLQSLHSSETCIMNFKKEICKNFTLSNGIIIKTKLQKNRLKQKLNIDDIKQIAFLEDSNIFLVQSKTPIKDFEKFKKLDFIEYVVPDIIQSRQKNSIDITSYQKKLYLENLWSKSKGKGVNIAIIDDGFDLSSEEFSDTNVIFSYDVDTKTLDASPKTKLDTHGTKVAGIIFAKHNGNDVEGIAPEANFIAIRQTTNKLSDTILAFTIAKKAGADIINCSWNSLFLVQILNDVIRNIILDNTTVVFAAGNEHKKIEPFSIEASIPEVITVGAEESFSNYGDIVDFKLNSKVITIGKNNKFVKFGGTSSTAPIISGLLALIKSSNIDKKMKEIEIILKEKL